MSSVLMTYTNVYGSHMYTVRSKTYLDKMHNVVLINIYIITNESISIKHEMIYNVSSATLSLYSLEPSR